MQKHLRGKVKLLAINTAGMHRYMSVDMWKFYESDKSLWYMLEIRIFFFEKMVFKQESLCYSIDDLHRI